MSQSSVFEKLVTELSASERGALLGKLNQASSIPREPLQHKSVLIQEGINYKAIRDSMGMASRLILFLKSIFTGKPADFIIKESFLKKSARAALEKYPGLIDSRRNVLLTPFMDELLSLKAAAGYFYDLLDRTLEKNKSAFFAFLGSLNFERVHEELKTETDPYVFSERNSLAGDSDVRVGINSAFETILSRIDDDSRRSMLYEVRNLHALKQLSGFMFDRFIAQFRPAQNGRNELSLFAVKELVRELAEILYSLDTPSPSLIEAMFAFSFSEEFGHESFNIDEAVQKEIARADKALGTIRQFNFRVPMYYLVQLAHNEPDINLVKVSGGEDWFSLFKGYWRERIDRTFKKWQAERRFQLLEADIRQMVGDYSASRLEYLTPDGDAELPPVRIAHALRFMDAFYNQVFLTELNKCLKIILLEGEFYKRDNRVEFTDAYNTILQISEVLREFNSKLAPEGELTWAWTHARDELISLLIKRKKIESALHTINREAEDIVSKAIDGIKKMKMILHAILAGESRGKYDSLSNLTKLQGKSNREFINQLETAMAKFERAAYILEELEGAALADDSRS